MELNERESIIEGILFASGEPVRVEKICQILDLPNEEVQQYLKNLSDYYAFNKRGMRLIFLNKSVQMISNPDLAPYIRAALETRRPPALSTASLEVLSIVAYKQPVTRAAIEQIRGVDSSGTILNLIDKNLIQECGKLDVPGRPNLYKTTTHFLRIFNIRSLDELPNFAEYAQEDDGLSSQLSLLDTED